VLFFFHIFYCILYFPDNSSEYNFENNYYSNLRPSDTYIQKADIPSNTKQKDKYLQLFIRYDVEDNRKIKTLCPDFKPENYATIPFWVEDWYLLTVSELNKRPAHY